jgi:hypothetical protein
MTNNSTQPTAFYKDPLGNTGQAGTAGANVQTNNLRNRTLGYLTGVGALSSVQFQTVLSTAQQQGYFSLWNRAQSTGALTIATGSANTSNPNPPANSGTNPIVPAPGGTNSGTNPVNPIPGHTNTGTNPVNPIPGHTNTGTNPVVPASGGNPNFNPYYPASGGNNSGTNTYYPASGGNPNFVYVPASGGNPNFVYVPASGGNCAQYCGFCGCYNCLAFCYCAFNNPYYPAYSYNSGTNPYYPAYSYNSGTNPYYPASGGNPNFNPYYPASGGTNSGTNPYIPAPGGTPNFNPYNPAPGGTPNFNPYNPAPGGTPNFNPTNPAPGGTPNFTPTAPNTATNNQGPASPLVYSSGYILSQQSSAQQIVVVTAGLTPAQGANPAGSIRALQQSGPISSIQVQQGTLQFT